MSKLSRNLAITSVSLVFLGVGALPARAAVPTQSQIDSVIQVLQSFNVDPILLSKVYTDLGGVGTKVLTHAQLQHVKNILSSWKIDAPIVSKVTANLSGQLAPSSVTVVFPNVEGHQWGVGESHDILWKSTNLPATAQMEIILVDSRYTGDTTSAKRTIAQVPNTGRYSWTVPQDVRISDLTTPTSAFYEPNYKILVRSSYQLSSGAYEDSSDVPFSIVPSAHSAQYYLWDMNRDKKLNSNDVERLRSIINGSTPCSGGADYGYRYWCDINKDKAIDAADLIAMINIVSYNYNNDGVLNEADVNLLSQIAAGTLTCPAGKKCDINGNGRVDASDVNELRMFMNKIKVSSIENSTQTASIFDAYSGLAAVATAPVAQSSFSYEWTRDLQIGSSYLEDVVALQTALTKERVYSGDITGGFYAQTFAAVKLLQQKYGIEATGYVGPETRAKLNTLY